MEVKQIVYQVACGEYSDYRIIANLIGPDGLQDKCRDIFDALRPKFAHKEFSRYHDDDAGFVTEFIARLHEIGLVDIESEELYIGKHGTLASTLQFGEY